MRRGIPLMLLTFFQAVSVQAAPAALATAPGGISVGAQDILTDAKRVPLEIREGILSRPEFVRKVLLNLLTNRVLANQAQTMGLDKDPEVATALLLAREKVLAEARVHKADGQPPEEQTLEKLARLDYDAHPDQFMQGEQVRVRHILIKHGRENARKLAEEVLAKAKSGADFAALAKEYSDDPGSKKKGGDLGWFGRKQTVPAFEQAAFALAKPGDISGIVETKFGYHIIELEGRRPERQKSFDEVKEDLVKQVAQRILRQRRQAVIEPVEASIKFNEAAIKAFSAQFHPERTGEVHTGKPPKQ